MKVYVNPILIELLAAPLEEIPHRLSRLKLDKAKLKDLARRLRKLGKQGYYEAIKAFAKDRLRYDIDNTKTGRKPPVVGEKRHYLVQKLKDTPTFVRVPLNTIDVVKNEAVTVTFEKDRVVIDKSE